ncbi:hypothetical protein ACIP27_04590 [Streptomyces hydrogenans]
MAAVDWAADEAALRGDGLRRCTPHGGRSISWGR